jgi:hypothetical protein
MAKDFCVLSEFESPKLLYKAAKEVVSQTHSNTKILSHVIPPHDVDLPLEQAF